jgi:glucosamine--fructose-6-phosphate aminotransferase (isomerizing)
VCGIVGYVGPREAVAVVLEALRRLEYRGYDSAGLAVHTGSALAVVRAEGKLVNLVGKARAAGTASHLALGHTRWATHGAPIERNAHPHTDEASSVAVVHNGIIENFRELRAELEAAGAHFSSDTDSEVVAHLLAREARPGLAPPCAGGSPGFAVAAAPRRPAMLAPSGTGCCW